MQTGIYCKRPMAEEGSITTKEGKCLGVKEKKITVSPVRCLAVMAVIFLLVLSVKKDMLASETTFQDVFWQSIVQELAASATRKFVPIMSFSGKEGRADGGVFEQQLAAVMPLYGYSRNLQEQENHSEALEEEYLSMNEVLARQGGEITGQHVMQQEAQQIEQQEKMEDTDQMLELLKQENEAAANNVANIESAKVFVPHEIQNAVDLQALGSYETLVDMFYTIDGNTMAGSDQLDVAKLLGKNLTIAKEGEAPQILIYHTHSQEGFADSVPGDVNTTIVGVGAHLSEILQKQYGYRVLHHTGQYDVETRDDAYSNSLPAIEQLLAENPSIEVIIDLHRDSMPEETKLVMDLDGRPTARFMFFNGLSRTKNTGDIAYLSNENQEDNLAFSFQMQLKAMEYYPGLTRKIYLKGYRYNMHLRPRTTLIELGAQNNTVEEAMNACDPLAHIIDMVLSGTM